MFYTISMPLSSEVLTTKPPQLGRRSNRPELSQAKAKRTAAAMVSANKVSPEMEQLIRLLATTGALTTTQIKTMLGLGLRTLQRYFYNPKNGVGHVLDYYRADQELVTDFGFSVASGLRHPRVWTLGVLGRFLAVELGEKPYTYNGFHIRQLTHDVLCARCVWTFVKHAESLGYVWHWYNKHDARIINNKDKILAEPDALLKLVRDGKQMTFYVEFHNEMGSGRGKKKAGVYYSVAAQLNRNFMPPILVFCRTMAVVNGYAQEYSNWGVKRDIRFYARSAYKFANKPNEFLDVYDLHQKRINERGYYDESLDVDGKYVSLLNPAE